jgi:hypothetical protein
MSREGSELIVRRNEGENAALASKPPTERRAGEEGGRKSQRNVCGGASLAIDFSCSIWGEKEREGKGEGERQRVLNM